VINQSPFCLQVSFKAPHVEDKNSLHNGYVYSPFYENYYSNDVIPPPPTGDDKYYNAFPELFRVSPKGIPNEARVKWDQRFSTQDKYQESVKSYYRLITGIDDVVKRLVDELKKNGLDKNTIIILSSDNGYSLGDHGLEGKWFGHDVSLRVPTIIYDGRQSQNQKINENIALNIDIAPTILDYAKVKAPKGMQGESLKPLIDGKVKQWTKEFYYNHLLETEKLQVYLPKSEGLVSLQYKYVRYFNDSNPDNFFYEELFDNSTDPTEIKNLAKDQSKNKIKNEMANKMTRYREALK
jgi:arylsulfatase A-like enzyme